MLETKLLAQSYVDCRSYLIGQAMAYIPTRKTSKEARYYSSSGFVFFPEQLVSYVHFCVLLLNHPGFLQLFLLHAKKAGSGDWK